MPANLAQIQIFGLSREEMDLVATIRKPFRYFVHRPGASVPSVAVNH